MKEKFKWERELGVQKAEGGIYASLKSKIEGECGCGSLTAYALFSCIFATCV